VNQIIAMICGIVMTGIIGGCVIERTTRETVLKMTAFGAVGDGIYDDSPAVQRALAAVRETDGPVRLLFDVQICYLGPQTERDAQFDLTGLENITIDGQGATLILHPLNGLVRLADCRNVTFKNFVIQHRPLPFMQGDIEAVEDGSFLWRIHDGFPLPKPADWMRHHGHFFDNPAAHLPERTEWEQREQFNGPWLWGSVLSADSAALKPNFTNHLFVDEVTPVDEKKRLFRVMISEGYREFLSGLIPGERFVLPRMTRTTEQFFQLRDRGWMFEQNVQVRNSSGILLENLTFYSARPGMVFGVRHNTGDVTIRGCTVTWLPGTDALMASWRDGVHCKNNRIGPVIENCRFEGLFDDSVNLSADAVMAEEILAADRLRLTSAGFSPGDEIGVFSPDSGMWQTGLTVTAVTDRDVTFSRPVEHVICGHMIPHDDVRATQFFNLSCANRGFVVRNNFFGLQRRHAVLARSAGLVENNIIQGVSGHAFEFSNTSGSFYEGPFPRGVQVRGNRIFDTARTPVFIGTKGAAVPVTGDILLEDNEIICAPNVPVRLECVESVSFRNNRFSRDGVQPIPQRAGVKVDSRSVNITFF